MTDRVWGNGVFVGLLIGLAIGWFESEGWTFRTILVTVFGSFALLEAALGEQHDRQGD
jgi:hypothetical protein